MEAAIQEAAKQMGYVSDRDKQQEAILSFMTGRNVFEQDQMMLQKDAAT